jgi:hypothetical protein
MILDELEPVRPIHDRAEVEHARVILQALPKLNEDELEAVAELVTKLVRGIEKHGHLAIDSDPRNFLEDELEELFDSVWYRIYRLMRLRRSK